MISKKMKKQITHEKSGDIFPGFFWGNFKYHAAGYFNFQREFAEEKKKLVKFVPPHSDVMMLWRHLFPE